MELGLGGRACIVTGGSGGIGGAVARGLAQEGAALLLIGRREDALAKVADSCADDASQAGHEVRVRTLAIDLRLPASARDVVEQCSRAFGSVDVLVNCASAAAVRTLDQLSDTDWQDQWEIDVMAPMRLMRAAAPVMAGRGWGRIVNVSSSSGKRPSQRNMAYSVTKAAQLSLSRAFADLYAAQGVLVNAVAPGPVADELWLAPGGLADQHAAASGKTREEVLESLAARVPLGRFAARGEIADVIVFLCSERASDVAGAAWSVDGGTVPVII
jgi:3-oxoacyl-[acyl-carrier protein] reductase